MKDILLLEMQNTKVFHLTTQSSATTGLFFRSDGLKMYVSTAPSGDFVMEYTLSTAWDITSATYIASSPNLAIGLLHDLDISSDGVNFVGCDAAASNPIVHGTMSTPWDITTLTLSGDTFDASSEETGITGLRMSFDGTKMYIGGSNSGAIHQYNLSTAWDITTASLAHSLDISSFAPRGTGLAFSDNGYWLSFVDGSDDNIFELRLSIPWELSSAQYYGQTIDVVAATPETDGCSSVYYKTGGEKIYALGIATDDVFEFDLPAPWNLLGIAYTNKLYDTGSEETIPQGVTLSVDGTQMFVVGSNSGNVVEYSLSTAFDISTATPTGNTFDLSTQGSAPREIRFKPDGTQMFVTNGNELDEYSLSTAWDITTASHVNTPTAFAAVPYGMHWRADGLKAYITTNGADQVREYTLTTAWDTTTMSFTNSFSVLAQTADITGVGLNSDGTKMLIGGADRQLFEYTLSTPWDITSASYDSRTASITSELDQSIGFYFHPDGERLYVTGGFVVGENLVLQYVL
jgi:DNA-binding beta-propeller fold protein YncE